MTHREPYANLPARQGRFTGSARTRIPPAISERDLRMIRGVPEKAKIIMPAEEDVTHAADIIANALLPRDTAVQHATLRDALAGLFLEPLSERADVNVSEALRVLVAAAQFQLELPDMRRQNGE